MNVLICHNAPLLAPDHPDYASEAGVLEAVESMRSVALTGGQRVATLPLGTSLEPLWDMLRLDRPAVVVNLCESFGGRSAGEICVPALLEACRIPYTGSPPECLGLVRHKPRTKFLLRGAGIPTPEFLALGSDEPLPAEVCERRLAAGPLFVKPAGEDASLGIRAESICRTPAALLERVEEIRSRYGDVLIESYIPGREFNVGVIALPEPRALPVAEILFDPTAAGPAIVTYDAKWNEHSPDFVRTPVRCPAEIPSGLAALLQEHALAAFRLCGCRDYARFDFRVDPDERPFLLEVNANPDPSPSAGLARMLRVDGIGYEDFVQDLLSAARRRA